MSIEEAEYTNFKKMIKEGKFSNQRLGQAFYNHFNLHKMNDQDKLDPLFELDGIPAIVKIHMLFKFD